MKAEMKMVQITFVQPDGTRISVEAEVGRSVMETAQRAGVDGIIGECGGSMACATCHCFFDAATMKKVGQPEGAENEILDFAATERTEYSRLSCQVRVTEALEGAAITLPEDQF